MQEATTSDSLGPSPGLALLGKARPVGRPWLLCCTRQLVAPGSCVGIACTRDRLVVQSEG